MAVAFQKRLFSSDEYHSMLEAGILSEDDRVELIEGEVLRIAAIGSRHAACVKRVNGLFSRAFRGRALVGVQDPVHLGDLSEPEPDLSVLRLRDDFYAQAHPTPADILLLVEVADASVEYDRTVKLPLYARSAIPEVWLVDLPQSRLEVYREPTGGAYARVQALRAGDRLAPEAFPEVVFEVARLLS